MLRNVRLKALRNWCVIIFVTTCATISSFGQKATIFGLVRELETGKGIDFTTVYVEGTSQATESDTYGQYRLEVESSGGVILRFSRIGYEDLSVKVNGLAPGVKRSINVKMVPRTADFEVVVRAGKIEDAGTVREEVTELRILPTASGNFESVLPHIALGVNSGSGGELTSQYSVRGGNYDENLVYVNDFEIFRPQLIRSGQQEGLSFPNIDLIRDLEFSSGGFEPKYGDKMSSVLDIRYKRPDEFRSSVTASFLGASAHVEGSFKLGANALNKLRYLFGIRYKTNAYLLGSTDIKGEYVPTFADIQAYLTYEISREWQVAFIANYNASNYRFQPSSGRSKKGTIDFQLELNTIFEGSENNVFNYGMTGLAWTFVPERKKNPLFMKWLVSGYQGAEKEKYDILGYYRLAQIETALGDNTGQEIAVLGSGTQHTFARNDLYNAIRNIEHKGGVEYQYKKTDNITHAHFLQWGAKYQYESFDDRISEWERLDSAGYSLPVSAQEVLLARVLKSSNSIINHRSQVFFQDAFTRITRTYELKMITGGRVTHRSLSKETLFSPRFQVLYKPLRSGSDISFKLATGMYHQLPLYRELRRPDGTVNTDLQSQKSIHFVGGVSYDFQWPSISKKPFRLISEVYYKRLYDIITYELDNVRIRYAGENNATGYVAGVDFRVNGEFVPGAESWINLSFLTARESINGVDHLRYKIVDSVRVPVVVNSVPRPTDQLMTLNMFFQDYLPRNENVKVNLNFSLGTGLPYGPRENNLEFRNFFRLKPYHRIDVGFSFQLWKAEWRSKKPHHFLRFAEQSWVSLEAFNLLQIANQASVNWIKTLTNEEYALPNNLTGRRINLRFRIDF
ncbi:MAG: TonB-dependent receptor [Saprospiraceae bacterium]|jgi:hypothetical protein|nr:TonB-dependent receptor [Saprospiraceae bacterium]